MLDILFSITYYKNIIVESEIKFLKEEQVKLKKHIFWFRY
jgi:hypothetical protein